MNSVSFALSSNFNNQPADSKATFESADRRRQVPNGGENPAIATSTLKEKAQRGLGKASLSDGAKLASPARSVARAGEDPRSRFATRTRPKQRFPSHK